MRTREERDAEMRETTTHCVPDELNGWSAAIFEMFSDRKWWYVHLGKLGHDAISVDDDAWDEFVTFVNEIDSLIKEKRNA